MLGLMKSGITNWMLWDNIKYAVEKIIEYLKRTAEPIIKGRKFVRPKLPERKYHRTCCQV